MPEMKRNIKDSVFTYLFRDPKYMRELYLSLHPEDTQVTVKDFQLVTLQNILANGQYNDLGMQVRRQLIFMMEAQSVFSWNIPLRLLLYLAIVYKEYVEEHELSLYSPKMVQIPPPELYMVYTGNKKNVPEELHLSDMWMKDAGKGDIDLTVKVLRGGDNTILGQYVDFCKITDQQRKIYGATQKAILETMRICQERGILAAFLKTRRKEVIDIMQMLFSQEEVWEMDRRALVRETFQKGIEKGIEKGVQEGENRRDALYEELLRKLEPLGRISDLLAAMTDRTKLNALAQEFGLKM